MVLINFGLQSQFGLINFRIFELFHVVTYQGFELELSYPHIVYLGTLWICIKNEVDLFS